MEKFIIGLFSEQLSTYIHGFRKEQLNANLLNGKGEISDVKIKVQPVNDILKRYTSLVELSSVYLSKLNFNVTSFRQIKKAPIEVAIDEVHIVLVEPMGMEGPMTAAWNPLGLSWNDIAKQIVDKANKSSVPYGLLERIQDNITQDINRVYVTFQPFGKFKTRTYGDWTPPALSFVLNAVRYVSVDEFGEEGSPDDVWRHNTRSGRQEASMRYDNATARGGGGSGGMSNPKHQVRALRHRTFMIYKKFTMEMSAAVGYRVTKPDDESGEISAKDTFMMGRKLVANLPLQSHICIHRRIRDNAVLAVQLDTSMMSLEVEIDPEIVPLLIHAMAGILYLLHRAETYVDPFSKDEGQDQDQGQRNNNTSTMDQSDHVDVVYDEDGSKQGEGSVAPVDIPVEPDEEEYDDDDMSGDENADLNSSSVTETIDAEEWPVLILPAGLVIVEKISASIAIHHIGVRIRYAPEMNAHLQFTMQGFMAELIWPLAENQLGGFVQMSLAYINVQETFGKITRQLVHGGHHFGDEMGDFKAKDTSAEEMFPMFENTGIRSQHLDLRSTFPVQVFGYKCTINVPGKEKLLTDLSQILMLHEIGVNDVVLTILPDTAARLVQAVEKNKDVVNPKWFSGDWKVETGLSDMEPFLQNHKIQNETIEIVWSPELMNITAKMSKIYLHLPPLTNNDIKSGTLIISMSESMFIASPSLPRLFLPEDVPASVGDSDGDNSAFPVQFPNDPKDVSYENNPQLEQVVRMQMTLDDCSLKFKPSLPFYDAAESNQLFSATKIVVLASYETSKEEIEGAYSHVFLSSLVQNANLNVDFDVLSNVIVAVASYKDIVPQQSSSTDVRRLISDYTGPFNLISRGSVTEFNFRIWRQHLNSLPVILLLRYNIEDVEIGARLYLRDETHEVNPFCVKVSIGKMGLFTNKFDTGKRSSGPMENSPSYIDINEVSVISFGADTSDVEGSQSILLRIDKWTEKGIFTVGIKIQSCETEIHEQIDSILTLIIEGALHPEWPSFSGALNVFTNVQKAESLDTRLYVLSTALCVDPEQINMVDVKVTLQNVRFALPYKGKKVILSNEKFHLFSGYLRPADGSAANHSDTWDATYRDRTPGFHHILSSTQKCLVFRESGSKTSDDIISTFSVNTYSHPTNLRNTLNDCSLSLEEWSIVQEIYDAFQLYADKFMALYSEVLDYMNELKEKMFMVEDKGLIVPSPNATGKTPLSILQETSRNELKITKKLLSELKEDVLLREQIIQNTSNKNEEEMLKVRKHLLRTEMDRLAAFSLVAHQMSGFLRIGGTAMSGQRFVNFTHFWKQFAVLKRSHLVIFKDTTQTKPLFVISLGGATIHSVSGSGAKKLFSRAFALSDISGKKTFFVAPTYDEFDSWMKALKAAIGEDKDEAIPDEESKNEAVPTQDPNAQTLDVIDSTNFDDFRGTIVSFDDSSIDLAPSDSVDGAQQEFSRDGTVASISEDVLEDNVSLASTLDSQALSSDRRGAKFRDRMAKMKASVKNNVKTMNENVKNLKAENRVPRRQRLGSSSGRMTNSTTAMKLKQVKAHEETPPSKEPVNIEPNQELHLMPGLWTCHTKIEVAIRNTNLQEQQNENFEENFLRLDITLCRSAITEAKNEPSKTQLQKTISQMIDFHMKISSILTSIQQNPKAASLELLEQLGENEELFAHVINSGKILLGLLRLHEATPEHPKYFEHTGSVISAFINSLFSNPIPTAAFDAILAFFSINDVAIKDTIFHISNNDPFLFENPNDCKPNATTYLNKTTDILSKLHNSEINLSRSERLIKRSLILATSKVPIQILPNKRDIDRTNVSNNIMQDALTSVMNERDEAYSTLAAARVFHAHQVDQQLRKIGILESRIEFMEKSNSNNAAAFFLGEEVVSHIDRATKIEKEMVQNVDAELIELCRQLSSSISSRVSSELEIVRLKESRAIEQEVESASRAQLEDELARYKHEAEQESHRRRAAEEELHMWKESFELMKFDDTSLE